MSKLLDVPDDMSEPIGQLAIIAGRIELLTALVYRAFLGPVNGWVKQAVLADQQFDRVATTVGKIVKSPPVRECDNTLPDQWAAWERKARETMAARNRWVHATWAQSPGGVVPVSATKKLTSAATVDAEQISAAVAEGLNVVLEGHALLKRVITLTQSPEYRDFASGDSFPEGATRI